MELRINFPRDKFSGLVKLTKCIRYGKSQLHWQSYLFLLFLACFQDDTIGINGNTTKHLNLFTVIKFYHQQPIIIFRSISPPFCGIGVRIKRRKSAIVVINDNNNDNLSYLLWVEVTVEHTNLQMPHTAIVEYTTQILKSVSSQ